MVNAVFVAIMEQLDEFQQDAIPTTIAAFDHEIEAAVAETRTNYSNLKTIQLDDDMAKYNAMRDELEAWRINVDERVKLARHAMMVWSQSRRNLGAGIPVPPLIDVEGLAGSAFGAAKKAVF